MEARKLSGAAAWQLLAVAAGALALSFGAVPQSLGVTVQTGLTNLDTIGHLLVVEIFGAAAAAVALVLSRSWPWLMAVGALGLLLAHVVDSPPVMGLFVETADQEVPAPPNLAWLVLLVVSSAVLLIGLLGLAQQLTVSRHVAVAVAVVTITAYLGLAVTGPTRGDIAPLRLIVFAAACLGVLAATVKLRSTSTSAVALPRPLLAVCAAIAFLPILPTALAALTGQLPFGTVLGWVTGLIVVVVTVAAIMRLGPDVVLATIAVGLVLAAPVGVVFLLHDQLVYGPWYALPLSLIAIGLGATTAVARHRNLATPALIGIAAILVLLIAVIGISTIGPGWITKWVPVLGSIAAVATAAGFAAPFLARRSLLPAAGILVTTMAAGLHGTLHILRTGEGGQPDYRMVIEEPGLVIMAVVLLAGAVLLMALVRFDRAASPDLARPARPSPSPRL